MSKKSFFVLSALAFALLSPAAGAVDAPWGHASMAAPSRVVVLQAGKAKDIAVHRYETIRITDGVTTITWTFDTLGTPSIPLEKIFPGAMGTIYVSESPNYAF
jgi:hypothetical protein